MRRKVYKSENAIRAADSGVAIGWAGWTGGLRVQGPPTPSSRQFLNRLNYLFKHTNFGLSHGPFENLRKWIYRMRVATQTRAKNIQRDPQKSTAWQYWILCSQCAIKLVQEHENFRRKLLKGNGRESIREGKERGPAGYFVQGPPSS